MAEGQQPRKISLIFYSLRPGNEPVREWLKELFGIGRKRQKELKG